MTLTIAAQNTDEAISNYKLDALPVGIQCTNRRCNHRYILTIGEAWEDSSCPKCKK